MEFATWGCTVSLVMSQRVNQSPISRITVCEVEIIFDMCLHLSVYNSAALGLRDVCQSTTKSRVKMVLRPELWFEKSELAFNEF